MELKEGDTLFAESRYHGISKVTINRFTPTQIVIEDGRFSPTKLKKPFVNGCTAIGTSGYGNTYYYYPTIELESKYVRKLNDKYLSTYPWSKLSDEKTKEVVKFLNDIINE